MMWYQLKVKEWLLLGEMIDRNRPIKHIYTDFNKNRKELKQITALYSVYLFTKGYNTRLRPMYREAIGIK